MRRAVQKGLLFLGRIGGHLAHLPRLNCLLNNTPIARTVEGNQMRITWQLFALSAKDSRGA